MSFVRALTLPEKLAGPVPVTTLINNNPSFFVISDYQRTRRLIVARDKTEGAFCMIIVVSSSYCFQFHHYFVTQSSLSRR